MSLFRVENRCRSCGSTDLNVVLDLGTTPLADRLVDEESLEKEHHTAPLTLVFCEACTLVQILETVEPAVLFGGDYPYFSSVSPQLRKHFRDSARRLIAERKLNENSLVMEAASNDGCMLRNFLEQNIPVLGIDPAKDPVAAARARGVNTLHTYFTGELAVRLRNEYARGVDLFLANNVLAHVADLNGFVEGIRTMLKPDGLAVIEAPYLVDLVEHVEFDTIYHQHLCYFSVTALDRLFRRHGLFVNEIEQTDIHGGSLRIMIEPIERVGDSVSRLLHAEIENGIDQIAYYEGFADRVRQLMDGLLEHLQALKAQGMSIAGYGAAAKATTLMSYAGIDKSVLDFIVDKNEYKHGRYMGGNLIPIFPPSVLSERQPDFVLILAWNFAEEIMSENQSYAARGGRFIVPIPELKVI